MEKVLIILTTLGKDEKVELVAFSKCYPDLLTTENFHIMQVDSIPRNPSKEVL